MGDNRAAEKGAFTFTQGKGGGEVVREAPFVYSPNVIAKVADCVEHNKRQASTDNSLDTHLIRRLTFTLRSSVAPSCYPCG